MLSFEPPMEIVQYIDGRRVKVGEFARRYGVWSRKGNTIWLHNPYFCSDCSIRENPPQIKDVYNPINWIAI